MTTIRLWRDNQSANLWHIEPDDLGARFVAWYYRHEMDKAMWLLERSVRAFITDHENEGGLQSVFDESDYETIHEACRAARWPKD